MDKEEMIKEINIIKETLVDILNVDLETYKEDIYNLDTKQASAIINLLDSYKKEEERNQYLEENDYVWHQLLKIQNSREYRSKFLKEFQKEWGEHTFPDYDEIYKRYDKAQNKIKKLERESQIRDEYLDLIIGLGFDYDGFNSVKSLKSLIDELVDYAKKAKICDDKSIIYGGGELGEPENILMEKQNGKKKEK